MASDWKTIDDDREKYQAYLCSREWAEKRDAVHQRAKGKCERCEVFAIDSVHHLTYARKYDEALEDLEGHCKWCHGFTHKKHDFDPAANVGTSRYFQSNLQCDQPPLPYQIQGGIVSLKLTYEFIFSVIDQLETSRKFAALCIDTEDYSPPIAIGRAAIALNESLPFDYLMAKRCGIFRLRVQYYASVLKLFGYSDIWNTDWELDEEE